MPNWRRRRRRKGRPPKIAVAVWHCWPPIRVKRASIRCGIATWPRSTRVSRRQKAPGGSRKEETETRQRQEFYKGKPLPDALKSQVGDNEREMQAQQATIVAKTKEKEEVRIRFAEEKKRYLELTGKKPAEAAGAAAPAPATIVVPPPPPAAPAVAPADKPAAAPADKPVEKK